MLLLKRKRGRKPRGNLLPLRIKAAFCGSQFRDNIQLEASYKAYNRTYIVVKIREKSNHKVEIGKSPICDCEDFMKNSEKEFWKNIIWTLRYLIFVDCRKTVICCSSYASVNSSCAKCPSPGLTKAGKCSAVAWGGGGGGWCVGAAGIDWCIISNWWRGLDPTIVGNAHCVIPENLVFKKTTEKSRREIIQDLLSNDPRNKHEQVWTLEKK